MGSAGGKKILELRGREYFVELGKKGAKAFYRKYKWATVPVVRYAIVRKSDNVIIKIIGEMPFERKK